MKDPCPRCTKEYPDDCKAPCQLWYLYQAAEAQKRRETERMWAEQEGVRCNKLRGIF